MAKRIVIPLILGLGLILGYVYRHELKALFSEGRSQNPNEVKLLFREDPGFSELLAKLKESGIIENESELRDLAVEQKIDTNQFAAGKYVILSGTALSDLLQGFVKGDNGQGKAEVKVKVIFNRCRTIEDIGANISKCILADSASLVDCIYSDKTLDEMNFTRTQIPALFLPDEYEMYFDTDAEAFVRFMADRFKEFWTDERRAKMQAIGLIYPSQVATLASIVYAEQSKMEEEWPIIAGLYLNRLRKGMLLQSDPTFKFCWGNELDGVERLLNKHKQIDCPYNTYLYEGLPPGPICVVPAKVVDAVLSATKNDYIFMCGKPGGSGHNFAATLAEHERNVQAYRKWLKEYLANK
jgi:UPF0755 protein